MTQIGGMLLGAGAIYLAMKRSGPIKAFGMSLVPGSNMFQVFVLIRGNVQDEVFQLSLCSDLEAPSLAARQIAEQIVAEAA